VRGFWRNGGIVLSYLLSWYAVGDEAGYQVVGNTGTGNYRVPALSLRVEDDMLTRLEEVRYEYSGSWRERFDDSGDLQGKKLLLPWSLAEVDCFRRAYELDVAG
jgi:hypothetical protein